MAGRRPLRRPFSQESYKAEQHARALDRLQKLARYEIQVKRELENAVSVALELGVDENAVRRASGMKLDRFSRALASIRGRQLTA